VYQRAISIGTVGKLTVVKLVNICRNIVQNEKFQHDAKFPGSEP